MACKNCERLSQLADHNEMDLIAEQLTLETDLASEEKKDERVSICLGCPFLKGQTCTKCGCYALFRASLSSKSCPVNKW